MDRSIPELLRAHALRSTPARRAVLALLRGRERAVSAPELEGAVDSDRVTVYRTLSAFEEAGLVHRVHDGSGAEKYALCADHCSPAGHVDEHAHFRCDDCGQTECLPAAGAPPAPPLPAGYEVAERILTYVGRCAACAVGAAAERAAA